jgi:DNA end-binding protein Ku
MKATWSGAISFGLVTIPISLYSAAKTKSLELEFLRKGDYCPVGYRYVCKNTGDQVSYENIVRGYEYEKGKYVVLTDKDLENATVKPTNTIEILSFVDPREIDKNYYQKPYYIKPAKNFEKIYFLLTDALRKTNKVGIARFVVRYREYLGALRAKDDILVLNQIRFENQLIKEKELGIERKVEITDEEMDLAMRLIERLTTSFMPQRYHDTYREDLLNLIDKKIAGKEEVKIEEKRREPTEPSDILVRLQESLRRARE